jgi:hypothetical protein
MGPAVSGGPGRPENHLKGVNNALISEPASPPAVLPG